ncbi:MAG: methyltransferase [Synechococcus sp.]
MSPQVPGLWVGQSLHFICLTFLLALVWLVWKYLGDPYPVAFWIAIAIPIVHQVFVWLAWRLELHSSITSHAIGFHGYLVLFFLLFAGRFISLFALAWIDRYSLSLAILPQAIATALLALLSIYTMYSVKKYFGFARAAGADRFDPKYRDMPLVTQGIFRFTNNGMYLYGFLLFWAIATGLNSSAAVTVAAFSHVYIWVHFYATEKPGMDFLYSSA